MAKHNHPPKSGNLIKGKCPECGGILEINKEKDAAICPYCGMPYIVEKAVTNYIDKININSVKTINAQVVNVNISKEEDKPLTRDEINENINSSINIEMERAEKLIHQEKYAEALVLCKHAVFDIKFNPDIERSDIWWNIIVAYTQNFTQIDITLATLKKLEECMRNIKRIHPIHPEDERKFETYKSNVINKKETLEKELKNKKLEYKITVSKYNSLGAGFGVLLAFTILSSFVAFGMPYGLYKIVASGAFLLCLIGTICVGSSRSNALNKATKLKKECNDLQSEYDITKSRETMNFLNL